jgi:DsbC/DsbD-like thiol-disulfide interchange protein
VSDGPPPLSKSDGATLYQTVTGIEGMSQRTRTHGYLSVSLLIRSCLVLCLVVVAAAQGAAPVVEAKVLTAASAAHPNSGFKMAVIAAIAPGYHINDHKPTLDYLIPTDLTLDTPKQLTLEQVLYPKGQPVKFAFSDLPLSVYQGTVTIGALLKVARAVPAGDYPIQGKLTYQACNDHACLPPARVPVKLTVKVVRRTQPVKPMNSDVFNRIEFEQSAAR